MLQWGRPSDNGTCTNFINTNSRLGRLAGDTAAAVMLMTSCTMRADQLWPVFAEQASRQFFGFHNSPYIGPNEARKVFERSEQGQPTADAWLEEMVLNSGGKNSPLVFTMGTSPNDASDTHGVTNLASGMGLVPNVSIEFVAPMVGYQLKEDEMSGELDPSLLVGYVLAFGSASTPAISRRVPIRLSLTELDAPIESLAPQDPDPKAGDARAAN